MKPKLKKKICVNDNCCKSADTGRTECRGCRGKREREKDPEKYAFMVLRRNARRRAKEFTITLEQFREFCSRTSYLLGAGKTKDSFHIDRIDETKGYHIDNIQVLTNTENVKKSLYYRFNGEHMEFTTQIIKTSTVLDTPF